MYTLDFEQHQDRQHVRMGLHGPVEFDNLAEVFDRLRSDFSVQVEDHIFLGEAQPEWEQLVLAKDAAFTIGLFVNDGLYVSVSDANSGDETQTGADSLADAIEFAIGWLDSYGFVLDPEA